MCWRDKKSRVEMWRLSENGPKRTYPQTVCYDPSQRKDHILSMSSLKGPESSGRKTLGGIDGSRTGEGCLVESQDCNRKNDSCALPRGMAGALELADCNDDCVELGENVSIILGQSKSCRGNEELSEWGEVVKMDGSGKTTGIGDCNEELRSSGAPKSTDERDLVSALCPKSGGLGS